SVNPSIAGHGGAITLERVEGNTVHIQMLGGCQGCAASSITLKQGIHRAFREVAPQVGAIFDETDHASGTNPYFKELPPEMNAHA
ncbi:MAG: NifU family protein, partial [Candidatus Hydrogenedentota bacterium]